MNSRRGFLKGMLGALAVAATAGSVLAADPNGKYVTAVRLLDEAIAAQADKVECNRRFDRLLRHCYDNFPQVTDHQMGATHVHNLLVKKLYSLEDIRGIPPKVADEIYAVALTRIALVDYRLPLDPSSLVEFDQFHQFYGKIIIAGVDRDFKSIA